METVMVNTQQQWINICHQDEIIPDMGNCVLLNGQQIAIFCLHDEGKIFAIDNFDPKSGANVLSRGLLGDSDGKIVVASPIYKQRYDLETGICLDDDDVCIRCFPVRIECEIVQLSST